MNLNQIPTEQLEKELAARKAAEEEENKPKVLENPDFTGLEKVCVEYIESLVRYGFVKDNSKHYIFEAAMQGLFGKSVWTWINEKMK